MTSYPENMRSYRGWSDLSFQRDDVIPRVE